MLVLRTSAYIYIRSTQLYRCGTMYMQELYNTSIIPCIHICGKQLLFVYDLPTQRNNSRSSVYISRSCDNVVARTSNSMPLSWLIVVSVTTPGVWFIVMLTFLEIWCNARRRVHCGVRFRLCEGHDEAVWIISWFDLTTWFNPIC